MTGDPSAVFDPHLLLRIDGTGMVTVTVPKSEMGQGVRTSLAMVVAEELDADWSLVRVETSQADRAYGDQVTGGSLSISTRFDSMRRVGAAARHMLIAAAAARWDVDAADCTTEPGMVVDPDGARRATYGELAEAASEAEPPSPSEVLLKDAADFRIVGQPTGALDAEDLVTGRAVFGSDVRVPAMVHGVITRPPMFRGRVASYDAAAAREVPGVLDVLEISTGIAVVADTTWSALRGRDALVVSWEAEDRSLTVDDAIRHELREQLASPSAGDDMISAEYSSPFFAHAALETPTCLSDVAADRAEVWAATQHPQLARAVAARGASLATDDVTLHVPLIGGGFGRRLNQDFVEESAELAAAFGGPVQLFWSRTDDLRHDRYHPAAVSRAVGDPADPANLLIDTALATSTPVPTGDWRSVTNAPDAFARQSFLDELAHAAGTDPYEYRRRILDAREQAVLDLAADSADWGEPTSAGRGKGIALHATWGVSPTAVVAEVFVTDNTVALDRVVCAIDCGTVVNPDTVKAQLEGAVIFAASAALLGGVTVTAGAVAEANYNDAPILRFGETPQVEVHIVDSSAVPTGVGEAGVPPIAPAIANAIFAATGARLRDLPLSLS